MLKSKLFGYAYLLLGLAPLSYLLVFATFLYYTGNGFGEKLTFDPSPEKKQTYLDWLDWIFILENMWIAFSVVWILIVILNAIFAPEANAKSLLLISSLFFLAATYITFFSRYDSDHGWLGEYFEAVKSMY